MQNQPITIEQSFKAPIDSLWKAITNRDEMKIWYFDFHEFIPEVGFEFQFWGGPSEDRQYLHLCKITEVAPFLKLAYSWRYNGYRGNTLVTFSLSTDSTQTFLKLTHEGLETFPEDNPDFARKNFIEGWNWIIGKSLKEHLEPSNSIAGNENK
jgi:uncharacterized protein YndB with AHSA1/START domain